MLYCHQTLAQATWCARPAAARGLLQLCCGRWFGLMRTVLFGRAALRMRRLVPTARAPIPTPGVSNALNMEAIQQVRGFC